MLFHLLPVQHNSLTVIADANSKTLANPILLLGLYNYVWKDDVSLYPPPPFCICPFSLDPHLSAGGEQCPGGKGAGVS